MKGFKNILSKHATTVAIDFGVDAIRCVAIEQDSTGSWIRRAAFQLPAMESDRPMGDKALQRFREQVRAAGLHGCFCRVTIASKEFNMEASRLPALSDRELSASARFEAIDRFGVDPSQVMIRHTSLGEQGTDTRDLLLFSIPTSVIKHATRAAIHAGLSPCSVEHSACAALRGVEHWKSGTHEGIVALLHMEGQQAVLLVMRDGALASAKSLRGVWTTKIEPANPQQPCHADTIPLDPVGPEGSWRWSSLAEETLRGLRQSCGESSWPNRMIVSGMPADDRDLLETLKGVCGVSVESAGSSQWLKGTQEIAGDVWASALGALSRDAHSIGDRRAA